jgi:hypothetical protein
MVNVGKWAFIVGIVLAIIAGFISASWPAIVLAILGLIVGFLNISAKEVLHYLVAVIALLLIGTAGVSALVSLGGFVETVQMMITNFIVFVSASGLVVAIKVILALGTTETVEKKE